MFISSTTSNSRDQIRTRSRKFCNRVALVLGEKRRDGTHGHVDVVGTSAAGKCFDLVENVAGILCRQRRRARTIGDRISVVSRNVLSFRHFTSCSSLRGSVQFFQYGAAPFANRGISLVFADMD